MLAALASGRDPGDGQPKQLKSALVCYADRNCPVFVSSCAEGDSLSLLLSTNAVYQGSSYFQCNKERNLFRRAKSFVKGYWRVSIACMIQGEVGVWHWGCVLGDDLTFVRGTIVGLIIGEIAHSHYSHCMLHKEHQLWSKLHYITPICHKKFGPGTE